MILAQRNMYRVLPTLSYVGQAGFIFRSTLGTSLGVDLYLSDCVERYDGFKRLCPKVCMAEDLDLDAVVATHWHLDHFDIDAIPLLMGNDRTKLIAAKDCKRHVENLHLDKDRIQYIKVGENTKVSDYIIHAVFCDHGDSAPQAIGLVLVFDGLRVYVAGDTCMRLDKVESIAKYGPFDIMIAPINGAFGNLNEEECAELCRFYNPKVVIPCHYWMFAEQHGDPGVFIRALKERTPNQHYYLMCPGEEIEIRRICMKYEEISE